jgi:hypothetical protein
VRRCRIAQRAAPYNRKQGLVVGMARLCQGARRSRIDTAPGAWLAPGWTTAENALYSVIIPALRPFPTRWNATPGG